MSDPKAVLDTNILVSALLSPSGNPAQVFRKFLTGTLDLAYSKDILVEYEDVLYRPRLRIPANDVETALAAVRRFGEVVVPVPSTGAMIDGDDRVFYDTAKTAGAYLITGNAKHYPQEAFILTPAEFLGLQE
ncbi:MAG: putative toxin-antitoxin system toxin component, PIN family [Deltaproteobacteria bacterium]|jgi:putative PIN family toxin of toxin-antitoxin system|nr:putative toxin-antitoxin system toxin component, PIN family [Deltaproteobacteria bacterium]